MPLLLADLDDTLIDREGAFRRWLEHFAARHGVGEEHFAWVIEQDDRGIQDRVALFTALRERLVLGPSVDDLVAEYRRIYADFVVPPPEATFAALRRLRDEGWRIGVVTNGPSGQLAKMQNARLVDLLDGWCISQHDGCAKPEPAIFRLAAERCGASLEGAWMIGDSGPMDIGGAVAAGISSVWLHRGREWSLPDFRPTATAGSFAEAVRLIVG